MGLEDKLQVVKHNHVAHVFTIPKTLQKDGVAKKVGIRELTSDEEITASKVGNYNIAKTEYESVKMSICSLDGKSTSNADGDVDAFWNKCGPKVRTLLLKAHNRVNTPQKDEDEDFFKSETVEV